MKTSNLHRLRIAAVAMLLACPGLPQAQAEVSEAAARTAEEAGKYRQAGVIYQRLLLKSPQSPELRRKLANSYLLQARFEEAGRVLRDLLAEQPRDVEAGRLLARVQMAGDEWAAAESSLERVLQLAPDDPSALAALGQARKRRGDEAGSEAAYDAYDDVTATPSGD